MDKKIKAENCCDVIVVGGGASGMMAAISAARNGASVLVLEKNQVLGKKLSITGGGRCNILNCEQDKRLLLANYGSAEKYLYSAFSVFGMEQSRDFFESIGIKIKTEAKKRAFPTTELAQDVTNALVHELNRLNVEIITNSEASQIYSQGGYIKYVLANKQRYVARNYIIATGGASYSETGSTGDGFKWLKQMGHDIKEPTPNITPLACSDTWVRQVSGVTAKDVDIIFYLDSERSFKISGDVLFAHFGISGPLILNNAYRVAELLKLGRVRAEIDCFPAYDEKDLDTMIIGTLEDHPAKQLRSTLRFIAPKGLNKAVSMLVEQQQNTNVKNSELSRQDRLKLVRILKALPLDIKGLMGFDRAVVADGGVILEDINTRTMQSNVINNLFITGDLININRPSGGYSLQLCWTTGYLAGLNASNNYS
jgi:predicted Rossmann fold flavoprotein